MRELKALNFVIDKSVTSRKKDNIEYFKKPKVIIKSEEKKGPRNIYANYKKYFLQDRAYYNLSDLLQFLKIAFGVDYENCLLRVVYI